MCFTVSTKADAPRGWFGRKPHGGWPLSGLTAVASGGQGLPAKAPGPVRVSPSTHAGDQRVVIPLGRTTCAARPAPTAPVARQGRRPHEPSRRRDRGSVGEVRAGAGRSGREARRALIGLGKSGWVPRTDANGRLSPQADPPNVTYGWGVERRQPMIERTVSSPSPPGDGEGDREAVEGLWRRAPRLERRTPPSRRKRAAPPPHRLPATGRRLIGHPQRVGNRP